jgi:hypothetical protein
MQSCCASSWSSGNWQDNNTQGLFIVVLRLLLLCGVIGFSRFSWQGLAQKIAIRLGSRFDAGQFVEINAHSLFSKWFSESGKLVTKMFNKITEIVEDRSLFVCVLIDEVESLTAARQAAANVSCLSCN